MMTINKKSILWVAAAALFFGVVLAGGSLYHTGYAAEAGSQTQRFESATPKEGAALIQKNKTNPDFVILDVRTPKEFADGHIEDALNLDYYSETFLDDLDHLDKTKIYLIYCRTGSRSGKAFKFMRDLKFQNVYHIEGGITRWQADGLPTTK
jgi:rhodanese-related sulfurtransferase